MYGLCHDFKQHFTNHPKCSNRWYWSHRRRSRFRVFHWGIPLLVTIHVIQTDLFLHHSYCWWFRNSLPLHIGGYIYFLLRFQMMFHVSQVVRWSSSTNLMNCLLLDTCGWNKFRLKLITVTFRVWFRVSRMWWPMATMRRATKSLLWRLGLSSLIR